MAYQTKTYHAPRKRPVDDARPGNRVVVFDIDHRHPGGQAFFAEGDQGEAYPTKGILAAVGRGALVPGPAPVGKSGKAEPVIDPESLHSLGLSDGTIAVLEGAALSTTGDLVAAVVTGDVQAISGIGKGRLSEITAALVKAGLIEEDGD